MVKLIGATVYLDDGSNIYFGEDIEKFENYLKNYNDILAIHITEQVTKEEYEAKLKNFSDKPETFEEAMHKKEIEQKFMRGMLP